jgi:PAS domain S-box-containing protein
MKMRGVRLVPEDRRSTILLFRWLIVLTSLLLMIYGPKGLRFASPGYLLAVFFFASNIALLALPRRLFDRTFFSFGVFGLDIVLVSIVIQLSGGAGLDLYALYFFIVFTALPVSSIPISAGIALLASILFGVLTYRASGAAALLQTSFLIKVPFFFLLATFGSLISRQANELRRQKEETRLLTEDLKKRLEKATTSKEKLYEDLLMLYSYNENILNSLDCGVMVMDLNKTITAFNRAAGEITGLAPDQVLFGKTGGGKTLEAFSSFMQESIERPVTRQEIEMETPAGEKKTIGISSYHLKHRKERTVGVVCIFVDFTMVKILQEKLKRSEHLAMLGQMAACVAHELRNPLSSIEGFSELIISDTQETDERMKYARTISKEVKRIDATIQEILTFSRTTKPEKKPVRTNDLLSDIVESLRTVTKEPGVTIDWMPAGNVPDLYGDEHQLRKVFSNLIQNSIQAIGSSGTVKVSARAGEDGVLIEVEDNGPGIPKDIQPNIFMPFFTTKQKGTGLGLALARKIVEDHEGTIRLESDAGRGARFTVELPMAGSGPGSAQPSAQDVNRKPTVLVADDDASIRDLCREVLETDGCEVVLAKDGEEAIRRAVASKIDLMVVDIKMPVFDGMEVIHHVYKVNPGLPIIVSTAFPETRSGACGADSNVVGYLTKPLNVFELRKQVEKALRNQAQKRRTT